MDHGPSHSASPGAALPPGGGDFYRGLFERIPVGVYRTSREGRLLDANPALVRIAGWPSRESFLDAPISSRWVNPDERERWQALMERDEVVHDFEYLHRRYDGTAIWLRETARTLRDDAGTVVGYEGIIEDVTERKAAEDRVRFQAELLAGVRESIVATDLRGNITYWNEAAEEMWGWKAAEVLGRHVVDVAPAESVRPRAAAILAGVAAGERWVGEFLAVHRDGREIPIILNLGPLQDAAGHGVGTVAVCSDITAQKRAEEVQRFLAEAGSILALSLDHEKILASLARLAVPTLADWCFVDVVDGDGSIRRVASAHADPEKDALARELMRHPRCPSGPTVSARVIRSGQTWWMPEITDASLAQMSAHPEHLRILRALGLQSGIAVPLVARGRTLGVLRFATCRGGRRYGPDDVRLTEELARRVALAIDNARLYDQAQSALAARERVLRVVSHDLRNPLSAVLAHADILLAAPDAPEEARRQWAGTIRGAAGQMARMIGDLLDASQLEDGRLSVEPGVHAPRPLAVEAVQMLRPLAAERDLRLSHDAPDDLPAVRADRERILQVLSNLLGNAIRFTPPGGAVTLSVRAADGEVRFTVADTGPGIAADEAERIFEPFWRGADAARDGLGLGLSIARGLVEAHGGRIWAEGAPGGGAALHFTLPAAVPAASSAAA